MQMNTMFDSNINRMDVIDMLLLPGYNAGMLMIYDAFIEK